MLKEEIKVLIVEDDATLGKVLQEAITRLGYRPVWTNKPDEALSLVRLQPMQLAIIDCMLPKMNGRDLALKIKAESDIPLILMSGIYKDKNFIKDAVQSTGALQFFTKPFNVQDLMKLVESKLAPLADAEVNPLYEFLKRNKVSAKERIRSINFADQVHGFDLPWIYSLLMDPRVSGHLNIITADGEVAGVGFSNSQIVQVNLQDTESFFGVLLVEKGYVLAKDLEETMKSQSGNRLKMGEKLVEANILSPHAVTVILNEQQGLRLSKTIKETSVKINFIDSDDVRTEASLDTNALIRLMNEWVSSKISLEWMKAFYVPWMDQAIKVNPDVNLKILLPTLSTLQKTPGIFDKAIRGVSLSDLISENEAQEESIYRSLHLLFLCRALLFDEQKKTLDYSAHAKRLRKLDQELGKQNYFERLGISQKAKESEAKRAYHELAKVLHPDKLPASAPEEIKNLTRSAFEKINLAYEALKDPIAKGRYMQELENGRADLVLQAESHIEDAKIFLSKGDIKKATELLEAAKSLAPMNSEMRLYLTWAKLKSIPNGSEGSMGQEIQSQLQQIPPEERHTALYYFVKGLYHRMIGDLELARKSFEHSVAADTNFIDARRELNVLRLQAQNTKQTDILHGDLKDVVGMLFKKRK